LGSITAIISSGDQIVAWQTLETHLRVTSRGAKTKDVNAARTGSSFDSTRPLQVLIIPGVWPLLFNTLQLLIRTMHRSCGIDPGALATPFLPWVYRSLHSQHSTHPQTLPESSAMLAGSAIRQLFSQRCRISALQRLMRGTVPSLYLVLVERPAEASKLCSSLSTFLHRSHSLLDSATISF